MKSTILSVFVLFILNSSWGQQRIEQPAWPHHGYENQMEALPFYNEACELYANGDTLGTINSLNEAINISFGLTEAQLFLAKVYDDLQQWEKALIYYNSGIDFEVRQKSHFYFKLFYLGMRFGEYDMIKHNMKHFKKLFGTDPVEKYEEGWEYGMHDWEYIRESIELIYNFRNWQSEFLQIFQDSSKHDYLALHGTSFMLQKKGFSLTNWDPKKHQLKGKKALKIPTENIECPMISMSGNYLIYTKDGDLYYAGKKGSKWLEGKKFSGEINTKFFDGQAYLNKAENRIYFVSDRNGSKDIFVAEVNMNNGSTKNVESLDRLNSFKEEQFPRFNEDETIFYFSSNGWPGFGGFDVFWTTEYSMENGTKKPMNPFNMKAGVNTKDDELYPVINGEQLLIQRESIEGHQTVHMFKRIPAVKMVEFELEMNRAKID